MRILGDEKNNKKNIFENYYLGYINALEEEYDTLFINEKEMHLKSIEIAIGQNIKENLDKTTGLMALIKGVAEVYKNSTTYGSVSFELKNK